MTAKKTFFNSDSVPQSINLECCDIRLVYTVCNLLSLLIPVSLSSSGSQPPVVVYIYSYLEVRWISAVRHYLSEDVNKQLLCAFVLARSDYCKSLLLSKQNNDVRHIFRASTSALFPSFHWLPIEDRIEYKLSFLCSLIKPHLPFRPLPAHYFPAAPLFCRHRRRDEHTTPSSAQSPLVSAHSLEPNLSVCPPCCLCHTQRARPRTCKLYFTRIVV